MFQSMLDPAILFFVLGALVGAVRSNLEIPPALAKFFSLYLLMALGMKAGSELAATGLSATGAWALLGAVLMAICVPAYSFLILRLGRLDLFDAAAVAATYGSVSAVTFIAAQQFLDRNAVDFGGYMTVALVVMESPAIVMALLLAAFVRTRHASLARADKLPGEHSLTPTVLSKKKVLHEALTDGSNLLLIGSLLIGFVTGARGKEIMAPFTVDIFKGILAFFLLEIGMLVARQLRDSQARVGPEGQRRERLREITFEIATEHAGGAALFIAGTKKWVHVWAFLIPRGPVTPIGEQFVSNSYNNFSEYVLEIAASTVSSIRMAAQHDSYLNRK